MSKLWPLSFVMLLVFSAAATAQGLLLRKKLDFPTRRGTKIELLQKVAMCSGIVIEYSSYYLNAEKKVLIPGGETTVGDLLELILTGEKIRVIEENDKIILVPSVITLRAGALTKKNALYGFILEEGTKQPLPFAVVKELTTGKVCQANVNGYYSLDLPAGIKNIEVSYAGHASKSINIVLAGDIELNLFLQSIVLPQVNVDAGSALPQDGGTRLEKKYRSEGYTNILGMIDPVRSLYLFPGNIQTLETTGKLIVRGGDPDQSLFLLDGNRVYNPSHLLGEISIVNNTSVKSVRQYKNDFPSRFGDAISSFTELKTKDGNMDKWTGEATFSFLAGSFTVEGPLKEQRTSLMFSLRHNFKTPVLNVLDDVYRIRFYDIHYKLTQLLNARNKLTVSGYLGKERLNLHGYDYQNLQVWGNHLATISWDHRLGSGAFVNTTVNYNNYRKLAGMQFSIYDDSTQHNRKSAAFNNCASIEQYEAKTQFEIHPHPDVQYRLGAKFSGSTIHPSYPDISAEFLNENGFRPMKPLSFMEIAVNGETEIRINPKLLIRPGIYLNSYKFRDYHRNYFQPRFFASLKLSRGKQISFALSKMAQVLHQVTSPFLGINNEFWVPGSPMLQPVQSSMINLGYYQKVKKAFNFSADIYYKSINNVTEFAKGGGILYNEDTWEQDIVAGKGWSYGAELKADKNAKRWSCQLSYTLSWSWRKFPDINEGKKYPFRYDRRHNIAAAVKCKPADNWDLSLVWYFNTGDWLFLPKEISPDFDSPSLPNPANTDPVNGIRFVYNKKNCSLVRGPSYHRLDLNTDYYFTTGKVIKHKISTGVYNAYQAKSKYFPDVWNKDDNTYKTTTSGNRLFGLTVYLSYSLNF